MSVEYPRLPTIDPKIAAYIADFVDLDLDKLYHLTPDKYKLENNLNGPKRILVDYGTGAVTHVLMIDRALRVAQGSLPLHQFLQDHQVTFPKSLECGFEASLEPLKEAGFTPACYEPKRRFFYRDDMNYFYSARDHGEITFDQCRAADRLCDHWNRTDFLSMEKLSKGLQYGKDFWRLVLNSFKKYSRGAPQEFVQTTQGLIDYYQLLIDQASF